MFILIFFFFLIPQGGTGPPGPGGRPGLQGARGIQGDRGADGASGPQVRSMSVKIKDWCKPNGPPS